MTNDKDKPQPGTYRGRLGDLDLLFTSEEDFRKADKAYREFTSQGGEVDLHALRHGDARSVVANYLKLDGRHHPRLGKTEVTTEAFGERLQRLLAESGRSQAWLVDTAGLSSSVVSRLVRGDRLPTFEHVAAMAPSLGLTVDALVAGTDAAQKIAVASQYVTRDHYEAVHRQVVEQAGEIAELTSQLSAARSEPSQASAQHRTAHQALSDKLEQTAHELSRATRELAGAKLALRRHQAALHHAASDVAVLHGKLAAVASAKTDPARLDAALAGLDAIGSATAAEYLAREGQR